MYYFLKETGIKSDCVDIVGIPLLEKIINAIIDDNNTIIKRYLKLIFN